MKNKLELLFVLLAMLMLSSACKNTSTDQMMETSTPSLTATEKSLPLATPYAQEPAAGICASPEGVMVTVIINPDIPDPRCSKVRAEQKLTIINQTQNTLEVSIGRFTERLDAGAQVSINTPFGEYLAPGVHSLQVSPCCNAELWLEDK